MLQDLERGRPLEIETQLAVVQDLGRQADVATPMLDTLLPLLALRAQMAGCFSGRNGLWGDEDMSRLARCHNVADLREAARRRLPRFVFEFMDRGTEDEIALRENRAGFERLRLRPDVLVDVSRRSLAIELFGKPSSLPLAMSPTGAAGPMLARGGGRVGQGGGPGPACRSRFPPPPSPPWKRVASAAGGRLWFQLYMWRDRALSYELINRARAAGYEALILTVDTPIGPNREYNLRNGFSVPFNPSPRSAWDLARHPGWVVNTLGKYLRTTGMPRHENYPAQFQRSITSDPATKLAMKNDTMNWADIPRLRDIWPGKR